MRCIDHFAGIAQRTGKYRRHSGSKIRCRKSKITGDTTHSSERENLPLDDERRCYGYRKTGRRNSQLHERPGKTGNAFGRNAVRFLLPYYRCYAILRKATFNTGILVVTIVRQRETKDSKLMIYSYRLRLFRFSA